MRNAIITFMFLSLVIIGVSSPVRAEMATMDEGLTVAKNWITLIIEKKGDWGGSGIAEVKAIQEFKRGERVIGYFCHVKPRGFIVISLRRELAPVKAYSAVNDLDPKSDEGMADIIKGGMERILNAIEQKIGPLESVRPEDLESILEINYRGAWDELGVDVETFKEDVASGEMDVNYEEGEVLLTTDWHQGDPFNLQCPAPPSGDDCTAAHCVVGCVATAGAQVMRYWHWPPYGVGSPYNDYYDWPNMPDTVTGSSPTAQINAVAELSHEVGIAVNMDYCGGDGCQSSAYTGDMEGVYEDHFRYSTACTKRNRVDYSAVDWFNRMKSQFNVNRPVQYRIPGHSIVGDGWQEIGSTPIRQYHMNYGWSGIGYDTWYTLDALYGGDPDEEYMLEYIYPAQALGSSLSGTYTRQSFPYRYVDRDATGSSATFEEGQYLQFLPGITVTCTSTTGGSIRFEGSSSNNTWLFTRGDRTRGARIYSGTIKLNRYGSVKFV